MLSNAIKYRMEEVKAFYVIGMKAEITNYQRENLRICKDLWIKFNKNIRKNRLNQLGDWKKFAFTYKEGNKLYYYCAIPETYKIPSDFEEKLIKKSSYLVFQHIGPMDTINQSINYIYKEFLPAHHYKIDKSDFFHFEKYGKTFYWNSTSSVIEIYVPILQDSAKNEES